MSIVPCDSFGNPGATGATFTVRMLYPGSNNVTPVTVTPSGTARQGRLVATVIPKAVGNPALQVRAPCNHPSDTCLLFEHVLQPWMMRVSACVPDGFLPCRSRNS